MYIGAGVEQLGTENRKIITKTKNTGKITLNLQDPLYLKYEEGDEIHVVAKEVYVEKQASLVLYIEQDQMYIHLLCGSMLVKLKESQSWVRLSTEKKQEQIAVEDIQGCRLTSNSVQESLKYGVQSRLGLTEKEYKEKMPNLLLGLLISYVPANKEEKIDAVSAVKLHCIYPGLQR